MQQYYRYILYSFFCGLFVLSLVSNNAQFRAMTFQVHATSSNVLRASNHYFLPSSLLGSHNISHTGGSGSIALTFDDGPNPAYTPLVLSVLAHYGIHATFFCVGEQVQAYPGLVRQEIQQGNAVENHSWNHANLTTLPPNLIRKQLQSTSTEIQQVTGITPALFRPPYGSTNAGVNNTARELGLTQVLWSVDTKDWQQPGVSQIVSRVLTQAKSGDTILMHDGGGNRLETVQALSLIIGGLHQRGFTFSVL